MSGREFDELVEDVRVNGLREPVVVNQPIDGRNRVWACTVAGVVREVRELKHGTDVASWDVGERAPASPGRVAAGLAGGPAVRTERRGDLGLGGRDDGRIAGLGGADGPLSRSFGRSVVVKFGLALPNWPRAGL